MAADRFPLPTPWEFARPWSEARVGLWALVWLDWCVVAWLTWDRLCPAGQKCPALRVVQRWHPRRHSMRKLLVAALIALTPAAAAPSLRLNWTDTATKEDGFIVERKDAPAGAYAELGRVRANVVTHTETTAAAGREYCYRVKAFNAAGARAPSNEACAAMLVAPSSRRA